MNATDTVEIHVHPRNLPRLLGDARERGANVIERDPGVWQIDDVPVILDHHIDVRDSYVVSYGGGELWR